MKLPDGSLTCATCKIVLTPDNASPFNFRPTNRQTNQCRECQAARRRYCYREYSAVREYANEYQRAHPEYQERWHARNKERMAEWRRRYEHAKYWADPEAARAKSRARYQLRKERLATEATQ